MTEFARSTPTRSLRAELEPVPWQVWRLAFVVVLGSFMSTLASSLINVGVKTITGSFHSPLTEAQWLAGDDLAEARQAEIGRLLKRRTDDGATPANKEAIRKLGVPLAGLGEQRGWEAMANWVIVAHFLAKGGAR